MVSLPNCQYRHERIATRSHSIIAMSASTTTTAFPSITAMSRPTIPFSLGSRLIPSPTENHPPNPTHTPLSPSSSSELQSSATCTQQPANTTLSIASITLAFAGLALCLAFLLAAFTTWRHHRRPGFLLTSLAVKTIAIHGHPDLSGNSCRSAVTASTRYHHPSKLHLLVLVAWILLTLDQLAILVYFVTLHFVCPQYSCRNRTLANTPGCAAPKFLLAALYLQVMGSAVFVCASINRFMHLYSVLSRTRYIFLRLAYFLVGFMLGVRLVALTAHEYVRLDQARWPFGSTVERRMHRLNLLTYTISYLTFGVLDLAALVQGLVFIGRVRHGIRELVMTLPRRSPGTGAGLRRLSHATTMPADALGSWMSRLWSPLGAEPLQESAEHQARLVMVWIAISISLLLVFAAAMTMLPAILKEVPVLLYNSIMTLLLKLFAAFVSLAITGAGRVLAGI